MGEISVVVCSNLKRFTGQELFPKDRYQNIFTEVFHNLIYTFSESRSAGSHAFLKLLILFVIDIHLQRSSGLSLDSS